MMIAAICPFETKKELKDNKLRRPYELLDVVYYMRSKNVNSKRVIEDYAQTIVEPKRDCFDAVILRAFPCLYSGMTRPAA